MADNDSGFAIGFLFGALAGLAVGFLYAPKAGRETRALLREKAAELSAQVTEIADKTREVAAATEKRVRERLA
jgi:gas vesicle protein